MLHGCAGVAAGSRCSEGDTVASTTPWTVQAVDQDTKYVLEMTPTRRTDRSRWFRSSNPSQLPHLRLIRFTESPLRNGAHTDETRRGPMDTTKDRPTNNADPLLRDFPGHVPNRSGIDADFRLVNVAEFLSRLEPRTVERTGVIGRFVRRITTRRVFRRKMSSCASITHCLREKNRTQIRMATSWSGNRFRCLKIIEDSLSVRRSKSRISCP